MRDSMNELSARALTLYDLLKDLDVFRKQDVVVLLNAFVELELRRHMATLQKKP
jgi:hypothetical protein